MADDPADASSPLDEQCRPCRGTGSVISNAGGESGVVECPWCEGGGRWLPGHDAQARSSTGDGEERPAKVDAD